MKAIRTIKLKISGGSQVEERLKLWLNCANWLSPIVFNTKELNSNRLHKAYYTELREKGLSSQLACSLSKVICASYKTLKSKNRWNLVKFTQPVIPVVWQRDFNRSKKGISLWGELLIIHDSRPLPEKDWKDSKLKKIGKQWYLLLSHEIEVAEPVPLGCIVGVDMGIKRMLVATNSKNAKTFFFHGGQLNHRRACIRRTRSAVQSVGTKSSRRLLRRMSKREAAVTEHLLHVASKALIGYAVQVEARRIVVEDLTNIRDSSLSKGKDLRSKVHRWPYANAQFKIEYKAKTKGIEFEKVSPRNTSRGCNACGHVSASNRKGLQFLCEKCGRRDDADRQASKNIRARSISIACNAGEIGSYNAPGSNELLSAKSS